ncbi:MAG: acyl carrier protein [Roseivirga sp.]|jgi:acyl carrier protein
MKALNLHLGFRFLSKWTIFRHYSNIHYPMSQIQEQVTQILVDKIGIASTEATLDANFIKDLGIDSLDYAEIVMEFEQTFGIRIPDSDAEQLQTISQAVEYITKKMSLN